MTNHGAANYIRKEVPTRSRLPRFPIIFEKIHDGDRDNFDLSQTIASLWFGLLDFPPLPVVVLHSDILDGHKSAKAYVSNEPVARRL